MKEKVLVVLGTAFKKKDLYPRPLLKTRLDFVIEEFNNPKKNYSKIILCGGKTQKYKGKIQPSESEVMKRYLISKGISRKSIIKESNSLNTIGNIAYIKKIAEKRNFKNLVIVTNNIFLSRVKFLVNKMFKGQFNVEVLGCKNYMTKNFERWIRFSESFWKEYCYAYFLKGIKKGDHKEVIKRLKNKNKYYPENYREDYKELKDKYFKLTKRKVK